MQRTTPSMSRAMCSALDSSIARLTGKYHGVFTQETVARAVEDSWARLTRDATLIPKELPEAQACLIYPGKHYEDWGVRDPAGKSIEVVREIRADIEQPVPAERA
jgi:protein-tyrosine-phosphatase